MERLLKGLVSFIESRLDSIERRITSSGAAKGCYKTKEVCLRDKRCQKKAYEKVQQKKNVVTFDITASNV